MNEESDFRCEKFAVIGAGPVGCIVAAYLARGGYDVTLCDVFPELVKPALDPGIAIEGASILAREYGLEDVRRVDLVQDGPSWSPSLGELWLIAPEERRLAYSKEIPLALADLKLVPISLAPLGKDIVPTRRGEFDRAG